MQSLNGSVFKNLYPWVAENVFLHGALLLLMEAACLLHTLVCATALS